MGQPLDGLGGRDGQPSDTLLGQVGTGQPQQRSSKQSANIQTLPLPSPEPSPEVRIAFLEGQLAAVHLELQTLKQEMESLITAVNMANEETQKVTSRMDQVENEWVLWVEVGQEYSLNPET